MIYPAPFEDVQGGPFGVVLADPPWSYENGGGQGPARFHNYGGPPRLNGSAYAKYDLMSTADICGLPISSLASTDSVLLLWATWPCLTDALRAIDAWGFSYITGFPWIKLTEPPWCDLWGAEHIKPTYGTGYWVRGCSEPLLICRRGKPAIPTIGACGLLADFVTPDAVVIPKAKPITPGVIYRIYERDQGVCQVCKRRVQLHVGNGISPFDDFLNAHIDHIIPRSRGGQNDDANLQLTCVSCNSSKGAS